MIELMMVMLLIGILSAMILPEMRGTYGDALLRSSARDLVNVFSIASSRAISLNELQVVRINAKTGRYEIQRQVQARGKNPEFVPLKDVPESSGEVDSRIVVELHQNNEAGGAENDQGSQGETGPSTDRDEPRPAQDMVSFYSDGTADAAEILLRDQAGFGLRLRISPITARVEILDLESK